MPKTNAAAYRRADDAIAEAGGWVWAFLALRPGDPRWPNAGSLTALAADVQRTQDAYDKGDFPRAADLADRLTSELKNRLVPK